MSAPGAFFMSAEGAMSVPRATIGPMDKVRQIRLAKDAMDRDWADPELDLGAVAAHAGYSRYHFLRAFKEAYGETPGSTSRTGGSSGPRRCCGPPT